MKVPRKYFAVVFAFFLTLVMVLIVTGVTTALNVGLPTDFMSLWLRAWLIAWIIAFPAAVVVAPWARRLAERLGVRPEDLEVSTKESQDGIRGVIVGRVRLPIMNATILSMHVGAHEVHAHTSGDANLLAGDQVWLTFKRYHVFDNDSGMRLRSYPETL